MPNPRRSSKPRAEFDSGWASAGDIAEALLSSSHTASLGEPASVQTELEDMALVGL